MNFKDIASVVVDRSVKFVKENGKNIAVTVLAEALDVPITTAQRPAPVRQENPYRMDAYKTNLYPKTTAELAIDTIQATALKMSFDSQRENAAKKILKIALQADPDTRAYAIMALNRIQETMDFDSNKRKLVEMVANLADPNYICKET